MKKSIPACLAFLLAFCGGPALAAIDPTFTPLHVANQSEIMLVGVPAKTANPMEWKLENITALKGKAPTEVIISLDKAAKNQLEALQDAMKNNGKEPVILCGATGDGKLSYLRADQQWITVKMEKPSLWTVEEFNRKMGATWAGATDKLIILTKYLLSADNPDVVCTVGMKWLTEFKVATIEDIVGMAPVELERKEGKEPHLFVASKKGDKLFLPKTKSEEFKDVTADVKLVSKSHRYTWVDINRDGWPDLVSWDGASLNVYIIGKDGTFAVEPAGAYKVPGNCLGLAPLSVSGDGKPGILVSSDERPFLLSWDGKWQKIELPSGKAENEGGGGGTACVVADFDNDGYVDIVQPGSSKGVLWRGKAGGFQPPEGCEVMSGGDPAVFTIGDINTDGFLDIFISGADRNGLWENNGKAGFKNVVQLSGSPSYKTPPAASDCKAVDMNCDGRPDLCIIYAHGHFTYHFNRGYGCLGEEQELRLTGVEGAGGAQGTPGLKACAIEDFNGDGTPDLALALVNGEVHCFYNDLYDKPGLRVRMKKGVTGPVTVSAWQGSKELFCVGTLPVPGYTPSACLSLRSAGECTVKWFTQGQPAKTKKVTAERNIMDVTVETEGAAAAQPDAGKDRKEEKKQPSTPPKAEQKVEVKQPGAETGRDKDSTLKKEDTRRVSHKRTCCGLWSVAPI